MPQFDVVVVGAGSTGGALAARLSEDPDRSVLLLEAGSAPRSVEEMPPELLPAGLIAGGAPGHPFNWGIPLEIIPGVRMPYPRGKGLGGSSSVNGCYFVRGTRKKFDAWADLGNDLWGFDAVLPAFRRLESDLDYDGPFHGEQGPVPITRERSRSTEFVAGFEAGCASMGFEATPDKNDPTVPDGYGAIPLNVRDGRRMGTAVSYLFPAMSRRNLTVVGNAHVERVLFSGSRATGVEALVDGKRSRFEAAEVVLSTGALRSPQLLMVSGIGPGEHLRSHGITVRHDLPGVGQNLVDHPVASMSWTSKAPLTSETERSFITSALHWQVQGAAAEIMPFVSRNDDTLSPREVLRRPIKALRSLQETSPKAWIRQALQGRYSNMVCCVLEEDSRGSVTLSSSDPHADPVVHWNLLGEQRDRSRFREILRLADELFRSPSMRELGAEVVSFRGVDLSDDRAVDALVARSMTTGHPSCTARMGPSTDATAVVDQHLRVHGIEGLRVADTSIFPTITDRGPAATAIMVGERLAELMDGGDTRQRLDEAVPVPNTPGT